MKNSESVLKNSVVLISTSKMVGLNLFMIKLLGFGFSLTGIKRTGNAVKDYGEGEIFTFYQKFVCYEKDRSQKLLCFGVCIAKMVPLFTVF